MRGTVRLVVGSLVAARSIRRLCGLVPSSDQDSSRWPATRCHLRRDASSTVDMACFLRISDDERVAGFLGETTLLGSESGAIAW
jgi:hypothetical protein